MSAALTSASPRPPDPVETLAIVSCAPNRERERTSDTVTVRYAVDGGPVRCAIVHLAADPDLSEAWAYASWGYDGQLRLPLWAVDEIVDAAHESWVMSRAQLDAVNAARREEYDRAGEVTP